MEPELLNEIDCGNFFDQIDDLIEFPPDNVCGDADLVISGDCKDYPTWDEALQDCDPLFSGSHGSSASDLAAELSVPYEDIVQLEWLSTFVEDSYNEFLPSSPVSVVECSSISSSSSSSSSSSGDKTMALSPCHRGSQRARSKRPRPTSFNPRPAAGYEQHKIKKIKITPPANPTATHHDHPAQSVRKCLHCQITKTPQWRAGPIGPKTLCNACGVRFKSGRLFPEYRPAASPTFVPALHSNSHKKVLEMRVKLEPASAEAKLVLSPSL